MLILPDGRRVGSISGGCLEGDVSKKAWWFTEGGRASVRVYDTSSDDDAVWEFGLGCNGIIHVLLERVETDASREALEFLDACRSSGKAAVMATVIRGNSLTGDRLFVHPDGKTSGILRQSPAARELRPHIEQILREKKSRLVHFNGDEIFVEWIGPPESLLVFGAGHDAVPVVAMAKQLGWNVTVADARPAYASATRFPGADRVVVMRPGRLLADIPITKDSLVVLMTHNYPQDAKLLRDILPLRPRYLGLLGPQKRTEGLFSELGVRMDAVDAHGPMGLDIGADTPEGIALSIVAEIQAELAGRPGMKLRHRSGPIHLPPPESGARAEEPEVETEYASCEIA